MSHQWEAEETIAAEVALAIVQKQFPKLKISQIRLLGVGWDNTAFLLDEEFIFRFPRRKIALPFLETEWSVLPKISPHLPLPVPLPEWKGEPCADFPWPFAGYKMLPGDTACHANLSEDDRAALAGPIADFLASLHRIPHVMPFSESNRQRIDAGVMITKIQKNLSELSDLKLFSSGRQIEKFLSDHFREPKATSLVHGDFYVRHLLVNDKHQLTGVIDWGDVHFGDPAIDLAIAHNFLPQSAHEVFRKAYGGIAEDTWQLAKLRAILSSTYIALFGHHTGDRAIAREGVRSLNLLNF